MYTLKKLIDEPLRLLNPEDFDTIYYFGRENVVNHAVTFGGNWHPEHLEVYVLNPR